ncbi:MAG: aldose 1-epimerase family protein [Clostridia bacterium]|nr:aldose 1-epimerase family protein [Clostridia bacterium]
MILENEYLKVEVADHGAELTSLYDKRLGAELLWQADPAYWGRHAPVLFPFVGKVNGGTYRYHGKTYAMGQHGFARDMDFACVYADGTKCVHRLTETAETLAVYPFRFQLDITHALEKNTLRVTWDVTNPSDAPMYFSIGGHPAFRCPVLEGEKRSDYAVRFGSKREMTYTLIDPETSGLDVTKPYALSIPEKGLALTADMFDRDALVFDGGQVEEASIVAPDGTPRVTMRCPGFPSFGLWSKPFCEAPYVCLEPWFGRVDDLGFAGALPEKTYEQYVPAGETFTRGYTITAGEG